MERNGTIDVAITVCGVCLNQRATHLDKCMFTFCDRRSLNQSNMVEFSRYIYLTEFRKPHCVGMLLNLLAMQC